MNRTILFRGKRVDNGEWVYGGYDPMDGYHTIFEHSDITHSQIEVIPETVGQYTGLKDKNGVKIFEGDVIRAKGKRVFFIEYCCAITSYAARSTDGGPTAPCVNRGTMQVYEVIGNIHDKGGDT